MTKAVIVSLVLLVLLMTGIPGLLLLLAATLLGLVPPRIGTNRVHLTGCLLVPITLFFFGLELTVRLVRWADWYDRGAVPRRAGVLDLRTLLRLTGMPLPWAFVAVVVSLLLDLDRTISPSKRLRPVPALALRAAPSCPLSAVLAGLSGERAVLFLPALGALCHIFLDGLSGEEVCLVDGRLRLVAFQFRWRDPRRARWVCLAGLLLCPLLLFL